MKKSKNKNKLNLNLVAFFIFILALVVSFMYYTIDQIDAIGNLFSKALATMTMNPYITTLFFVAIFGFDAIKEQIFKSVQK